ncbi:EamA family transporter [Cryobacterium sp. PH31-O1]|uniref:EamA family transporter n=1 Tax=Cryobacterium sp. PH31-O1 TaxID=3046306 RepID=UPI0024BBAB8B|nr:EamA family transporter [Cryobacterium sp. PH31-O1]MDJ0338003.1 EamA family transporter [Cryobacterium sp. PH31-O1]
MLTAFVALCGAVVYGSADFLGGLAAKRISAIMVTAVSATSGLFVLVLVLPFVAGQWSVSAVLWGALSGVTGALAITLLYACLAIGPMSILSPLTAVVSAIVPMTAGLLGGERFLAIGYWALGLALIAVVLVGFVPERGAVRPRPVGIVMAIGAGILIGTFIILIDQTPADSGIIPLVMNRFVSGGIMFAVVGLTAGRSLQRRRAERPAPRARSTNLKTGVKLAIACGVIDVTANLLLLLGLRLGDLSVVSVLTAMYPSGTILLAAVVLRERIAPVQWLGLVLALTAAGMLAIA